MFVFDYCEDLDIATYEYRIYQANQVEADPAHSGYYKLINAATINSGTIAPYSQGFNLSNVFTVAVENSTTTSSSTTTSPISYYGAIRAIDTSANLGPWTLITKTSTDTPLIDQQFIGSLTAAKITTGTLGAAEITLNGANSIIKSSNYSAGSLGWKITGLGDAEFNDLTVRTALDIGGSDASSFHVDVNGNLWLGDSTYGSAPFRVSNAGVLTATGVNVSGAITATSGTFNGRLQAGDIYIPSFASPVFSVTTGGALTATGANITGTITATSGTFTGAINASSGSFTGKITVPGTNTQFGKNINDAANYQGIKVGGLAGEWKNAWVERSDGSVYFNAQNVAGTNRFYMDSTDSLLSMGNGVFSVTNAGAVTASSVTITGGTVNGATVGGVNTSSDKLFLGVGNYSNNDTPFFVGLHSGVNKFSLGSGLTWDGGTLTINGGGTFSGTVQVGDVEIGNDVGPGGGHHGISLSPNNFSNIFLRRASDGVYFFRVNEGGTNSITFDSSSGIVNITGSINAGSFNGGSILIGTSTTNGYLSINSGNRMVVNGVKFFNRDYSGWDGQFYPYSHDTYNLGLAGSASLAAYYWMNIYYHGSLIGGSDRRRKNTIEDSNIGLKFIEKLRPVSYKMNVKKQEAILDEDGNIIRDENEKIQYTIIPGERQHYGLIAQEVKEVMDDLNISALDFAGWGLDDPENEDSSQVLMYIEFISPLIKAVQELSVKVDELESRLV